MSETSLAMTGGGDNFTGGVMAGGLSHYWPGDYQPYQPYPFYPYVYPHVCPVNTTIITTLAACSDHCRCLKDTSQSYHGQRTKPHMKCCKCGDVMAKEPKR